MEKKFIIELLDDCPSEFKGIVVFGLTPEGQISAEPIPVEDLPPYTEPDLEQVRKEAFKNGYDAACKDIDIKSKINAAYQKGLEDAWDAARKISSMDSLTRDEVFGLVITSNIFDENTASEAIEKIRQYEQECEEIKIGDEVSLKSGAKGFVTRMVMFGDEQISAYVVWSDGYVGSYNLDGLQKTGKHYSEIAEVLAKMKEGE